MADVKISGLPASTTPLAGTEVLPIVQDGVTKQVSVNNLTDGRNVTVAAGTVSAPAITTTGDTNTGMYFPAADTIAFTEGGAEVVRINSSGNVQVGGQNGSAKLNVTSDSTFRLFNTAATNQTDINFSDAQTLSIATYHGSGSAIRFSTTPSGGATTERMRINSSGNVGIGVASIGAKLELGGAATGQNILFSQTSSNTATRQMFAISYKTAGHTPTVPAIAGFTENSFDDSLGIRFYNSYNETMRINKDGNLGIGTTSPSASAILDAQSTTKGVRMPNMTTAQKNAIVSPAAGLMIFDTTLAKLCVYSGSAWQTITSV